MDSAVAEAGHGLLDWLPPRPVFSGGPGSRFSELTQRALHRRKSEGGGGFHMLKMNVYVHNSTDYFEDSFLIYYIHVLGLNSNIF